MEKNPLELWQIQIKTIINLTNKKQTIFILNPEQKCMKSHDWVVIKNMSVKLAVVLINEFTGTKEILKSGYK